MLRLKAATPGLPASRLAELMRLERTRDAQGAEARRELGTLKGYADESAGVYDEMAQETRDVDSYKVPERKGPSKGQQLFGIGLGLLGAATGHRDPASLTGQAIGGAKERADQEYADEMAALDRRIATNKEAKMAKIAALQARLGGIGQRADVAKLGLGLASDEATRAGGDAMRLQGDIQQQENWERQFANANNQWRQEFGAQESAQRFHELPEAAKALQNVPYLIQSGMSPEDANRAVFSEWIIGNAQAKWMPQTLEQQFGMTKIAADSATEELSQLKTKGRYLEPMLKQESAASALSMANTRQIMSERAEQIKSPEKPIESRKRLMAVPARMVPKK